MKKRMIIGGVVLLFAAITALNMDILQSNKAGNVALKDIITMVNALNENNGDSEDRDYVKGTWGTNWNTYEVECWMGPTNIRTNEKWSGSSNNSVSVSASIPYTPFSVSVSNSNSASYQGSIQTNTQVKGMMIKKKVCGYGSGSCLSAAPSGHPCS